MRFGINAAIVVGFLAGFPLVVVLIISVSESTNLIRWPGSAPIQVPYSAVSEKTPVDCPRQTERTAVIVAIGQSNAANHIGERRSAKNRSVVNLFGGKCYLATDPMLGATGTMGSVWPGVGDGLIASGRFDEVILVTIAIGASTARDWEIGGANVRLMNTLEEVTRRYSITHFLWHQGESDSGGDPSRYEYSMRRVITTTLEKAPRATFFVSVATVCRNAPDKAIEAIQRSLVDGKRIRAGPNTDALPDTDRYDACHFTGSGQEKVAALWVQAITH